jgi:hypothetical protein
MTSPDPKGEHRAVLWQDIGWAEEGPISTCLGWHCHPALEITGHMHEDGGQPHTHRPVVEWDMRPVPIEVAHHG